LKVRDPSFHPAARRMGDLGHRGGRLSFRCFHKSGSHHFLDSPPVYGFFWAARLEIHTTWNDRSTAYAKIRAMFLTILKNQLSHK
jgi:hypothetical protein